MFMISFLDLYITTEAGATLYRLRELLRSLDTKWLIYLSFYLHEQQHTLVLNKFLQFQLKHCNSNIQANQVTSLKFLPPQVFTL